MEQVIILVGYKWALRTLHWPGWLAQIMRMGLLSPLVLTALPPEASAIRCLPDHNCGQSLKMHLIFFGNGDRFWYQRYLPEDKVHKLKSTRLSDVIRRNTSIGEELQRGVFVVQSAQQK